MRTLLFCLSTLISGTALAELEPWTDYDIGERIYAITTVRVDANMDDVYLEGLKQTWVAANEVAKSLGHISEYHIYRSELPQSGEFNLLLVVIFDDDEDLAPSKARYDEFMKAWGETNEQRNREISKTYPEVRTITGEYRMREIMIK